MTQLEIAKKRKISKQMRYVARQEGIAATVLRTDIAKGLTVIPANKNHHNLKPTGIGKGLTVKVNANIGSSPVDLDLPKEVSKLKAAQTAGADAIMDLTIARNWRDIDRIRKAIMDNCPLPFGTVPIYQAAIECGGPESLTFKDYLKVYRKQAKEGVDFTTVHAGVTKASLRLVKKRLMPAVSRGGSFLLNWMAKNNQENFLYENFDELLDVAREFDVTISLGDGLRPGCISDATDQAQLYELKVLAELAERAGAKNVQVMIEGPGHIPLNEIRKNIELQKKICKGAPFYVLGPLPLDTAVGYDHVACSIGGALAAYCGADFLCYVTPKEHIGLPDVEDVREGVVVTKMAASCADLARGNKKAILQNRLMSEARKDFNWAKMAEYALDGRKFRRLLRESPRLKKGGCSMCGDEFCALKIQL